MGQMRYVMVNFDGHFDKIWNHISGFASEGVSRRRLMVMGSPALNIGITDPWAEYPDRIQNRRQALTSYGVLCLSIIARSLC